MVEDLGIINKYIKIRIMNDKSRGLFFYVLVPRNKEMFTKFTDLVTEHILSTELCINKSLNYIRKLKVLNYRQKKTI